MVSGYVDSQNSYGAMIRTPFTLKVYKDQTGWKSADKFESTNVTVAKNVVGNMILYWIIGLIFAAISFGVTYMMISNAF